MATAVVTGANSGIGLATAMRLAADGYRVFAGARSAAGIEAIEAAAAIDGAAVDAITIDVTDGASVEAAFAAILEDAGPVSVLVNNAGVGGGGTVEETPIAVYQQVLDTNVLGAIRCTQQVLPGMREAGAGSVVNISSVAGISGPPVMSAYAASKFALEGVSESLQCEVGRFGIRVFIIRPGVILTPIWAKSEVLATEAYQEQSDAMVQIIGWGLGNEAVGPEVVADVIADAIAAETHVVRHVAGNADRIARMRAELGDEELLGVWGLDEAAFRDRYSQLAGADYWS